LEHYHKEGHQLTIEFRKLDVWCYSCNSYLGDSNRAFPERVIIGDIRKFLLCPDLYSHCAGWIEKSFQEIEKLRR